MKTFVLSEKSCFLVTVSNVSNVQSFPSFCQKNLKKKVESIPKDINHLIPNVQQNCHLLSILKKTQFFRKLIILLKKIQFLHVLRDLTISV